MFKIRSLRARGTTVEVRMGGKTLYKQIVGMGVCDSENLTDDIKSQAKLGFVKFWSESADPAPKPKKEEKAAEAAEAAPPPPPPADEPPADDPPAEDPPADLPKFLTEEELRGMKKSELATLVEKFGLDVDTDQRKSDLLDGVLQYNIPRE